MNTEYADNAEKWPAWLASYNKEKDPQKKQEMTHHMPSVSGVSLGQLIPYHMSGKDVPTIYNGVQAVKKSDGFLAAKDYKIDGLPGR